MDRNSFVFFSGARAERGEGGGGLTIAARDSYTQRKSRSRSGLNQLAVRSELEQVRLFPLWPKINCTDYVKSQTRFLLTVIPLARHRRERSRGISLSSCRVPHPSRFMRRVGLGFLFSMDFVAQAFLPVLLGFPLCHTACPDLVGMSDITAPQKQNLSNALLP